MEINQLKIAVADLPCTSLIALIKLLKEIINNKKISKGVTMSEEEKMKMAIDFAKQGIDLEDVEKWVSEIYEDLKPFFDLVEKNKRILDKYDKKE